MTHDDRIARARRWAKATGHYYGRPGGWIYRATTGRPYVQGYGALFARQRAAIEAWEATRKDRTR